MTLDLSDYGRMGVEADAVELIEHRTKAGKAMPLFVYGTLREGERLHHYYASGVVKIRHEATASGVLYYPGHRSFPGARFDEEGTIVGDLLWYKLDSLSLLDVIRMELSAGYSLVAVRATYNRLTGRPHRKQIQALAFHHLYSGDHCERVPGGDWKSVAARKLQRAI